MDFAVAALRSELIQFNSVFDPWMHKTQSDLNAVHQQHEHDVEEGREEIAQLNAQHNALIAQSAALHAEITNAKDVNTSLKQELTSLRDESTLLPERISTLNKRDTDVAAAAATERQELLNVSSVNANQLSLLQREVALFSRALGIHFAVDRQRQTLAIVYDHLDGDDDSRQCRLNIFVDENDEYAIESCHPELSSNIITRLIDECNRSNNFTKFIGNIRTEFKQFILQEKKFLSSRTFIA